MANSWLRLYHDMPNDPKWRTIARAAKQTIPVVLAVYVHLLTIASGAVDRGTLVNVNSEDLASALDVDSAAVDEVLKAMQGRVLEGAKLSGWDKRQTNREDSSTERVKRYRERKVTQVKRNVTQMEPDVTADKSREEEIRQESTKTLASTASAVPAAQRKLVCTLPLNTGVEHEVFDVDVQEWVALYPAVDIRQELRNMKGWLLGSPQRRKTRTGIGKFINAWFSRAQNEARPGGTSGENQQNQRVDAATERKRTSDDAIGAAVARRLNLRVGEADAAGEGLLPQPDSSGRDSGRVPEGMGRDSPAVRDGTFQGRTLEGVA